MTREIYPKLSVDLQRLSTPLRTSLDHGLDRSQTKKAARYLDGRTCRSGGSDKVDQCPQSSSFISVGIVYDVKGSFAPRQFNEKTGIKSRPEAGHPSIHADYANGNFRARPLKYDRLLCSLDHSTTERATESVFRIRLIWPFFNDKKAFSRIWSHLWGKRLSAEWILS